MIKTIGLIMIVTSCSMMGISMQRELKKRKTMLKAHISALQMIRTEIFYKNAALDSIIGQLSGQCSKAASDFYQKVFELAASGLAFSTAANQFYDQLIKEGLLKEDVDIIRSACKVIGRYDGTIQTEQLSAAVKLLECNLSALQNELNSKGRLYKTAGATAGIILALLVL